MAQEKQKLMFQNALKGITVLSISDVDEEEKVAASGIPEDLQQKHCFICNEIFTPVESSLLTCVNCQHAPAKTYLKRLSSMSVNSAGEKKKTQSSQNVTKKLSNVALMAEKKSDFDEDEDELQI